MVDLTEEEQTLQKEACEYISAHKNELIEQFITTKRPLPLGYTTIFMAGSPGAGKTEFSQRYKPEFEKNDSVIAAYLKTLGMTSDDIDCLFIRIDVDEIRSFLPQYRKTDPQTGAKGNSHVIQKAANKGLDILRNFCLKNDISFLHDGTFSNLDTMRELIKKSLADDRSVVIFFIYIDPMSAWAFTQAREQLEGRNIIKEKFIEQYFASKANVDAIKAEFGNEVRINFVLKNAGNNVVSTDFNILSIDQYLRTQYNNGVIKEYTQEELSTLIS